jgi:hypothetical protein
VWVIDEVWPHELTTSRPTQGEYFVRADGTPYLIERANRGGGVYTVSPMVPSLSYAPMTELPLRSAFASSRRLTKSGPPRSRDPRYSLHRLRGPLYPPRDRRIDDVLAIRGVLTVHIRARVGRPLPEITRRPPTNFAPVVRLQPNDCPASIALITMA